MSLYFPYLNPGTMGAKGAWYLGFGVADKAPKVRPWKDPWKETISCFAPVVSRLWPTFRANLRAASLASVPELQMNAWVAVRIAPEVRVVLTSAWLNLPVCLL